MNILLYQSSTELEFSGGEGGGQTKRGEDILWNNTKVTSKEMIQHFLEVFVLQLLLCAFGSKEAMPNVSLLTVFK